LKKNCDDKERVKMDVTTCDKCGVYTPFNKWVKEDLCPDCEKKIKEENQKK
jgi:rRNA maturation protein Nop10